WDRSARRTSGSSCRSPRPLLACSACRRASTPIVWSAWPSLWSNIRAVSTHFAITHELDATPEEFWRVFLHEPYNIELYQRIGVKERTVLDRSESAETVKWAVRIVPKRDLPALIKKVIGGDLGYTEISTYYKGKNYIDVRVEPTLMKERTKIQGIYTVK